MCKVNRGRRLVVGCSNAQSDQGEDAGRQPVPIRKLRWGRRSSRCENERFSCKVQEIKDLRGGVLLYAAQGNPKIDAEIAEKRRFRTGTSPLISPGFVARTAKRKYPLGLPRIGRRSRSCATSRSTICDKSAYLTGLHGEGGEVPCPVGFSTRGARSRTREYVEHPEARKHRWARCIAGRSRKLVRYAG